MTDLLQSQRKKRGILTSNPKAHQEFESSYQHYNNSINSNSNNPNININPLPYIQAANTQKIILDSNNQFQNYTNYNHHQTNNNNTSFYHNPYLDSTYNYKESHGNNIHTISSNVNNNVQKLTPHITSKPIYFNQLSHNNNNNNFHYNHNTATFLNPSNTNFIASSHNSSFQVHNPPIQTVIPPHLADGNIHTIIQGNVKKTFIPQYIYNQIPIYDNFQQSNTKYQEQQQEQQKQQNLAYTYEVMMKQYQKIYQKMQQQKGKNAQLDKKIRQLQAYIIKIQSNSSNNNNTQVKLQTRRKKKILNKNQLLAKLQNLYSLNVNEIIRKRKTNALNRLGDLFSKQYEQYIVVNQIK